MLDVLEVVWGITGVDDIDMEKLMLLFSINTHLSRASNSIHKKIKFCVVFSWTVLVIHTSLWCCFSISAESCSHLSLQRGLKARCLEDPYSWLWLWTTSHFSPTFISPFCDCLAVIEEWAEWKSIAWGSISIQMVMRNVKSRFKKKSLNASDT